MYQKVGGFELSNDAFNHEEINNNKFRNQSTTRAYPKLIRIGNFQVVNIKKN